MTGKSPRKAELVGDEGDSQQQAQGQETNPLETTRMRKALVIGIVHYDKLKPLHGCVNDARAVSEVLEVHGDGSPNFGVSLRTASSANQGITRGDLKDLIEELFADDS